jgi:hypothetical protein
MNTLFGFILTRHVNSRETNKYWNRSVKILNRYYPETKIVIIDDNSNSDFLESFQQYKNLTIIQSEFPKRGELLPFYYYHKYKFFPKAIILHDSVFFHKKIHFEKLSKMKVFPFWHFEADNENTHNILRISSYLKNSAIIDKIVNKSELILGMPQYKWYGCFGCMCYIDYKFLYYIQLKYDIFNMLNAIKCRSDRCSLERIMGIIFYNEFTELIVLYKTKSLLGNIFNYQSTHTFGSYTYSEYEKDMYNKNIKNPIIKVWTGR